MSTPADLLARERAVAAGRAAARRVEVAGRDASAIARAFLPPDLLELTGGTSFQWAGNVDVFVRGERVERHMAREQRVRAGALNLAHFAVGTGPDAYAFEPAGPEDWEPRLYALSPGSSLFDLKRAQPVERGAWQVTPGRRYFVLGVRPPRRAEPAAFGVRVRQRSSGREALVEFGFEPAR